MESTVPILWKMVYEKECKTIVVLYGLKESTEVRKRVKFVLLHWQCKGIGSKYNTEQYSKLPTGFSRNACYDICKDRFVI